MRRPSDKAEARVAGALRDHTMLSVIAAAANVPVHVCLAILQQLERRGRAHHFAPDCWGRA